MVPPRRAGRLSVLEPVQRGLARQDGASLAPRSALLGQQRQHGVVAQLVVVGHVLVSQGDARDALAHQRPHRVLDAARVPVVLEAGGDLVEELSRLGRLAQEQCAGVGRDGPAVEGGHHLASAQGLLRERELGTLCRHRSLGVEVGNSASRPT